MKKIHTYLSTLIVASIAAVWTAAGESSDPTLGSRDLPADIRTAACAEPAADDVLVSCNEQEYINRWIGKTADGDLFVVSAVVCAAAAACHHWVVEKTEAGASTLLALEGKFRLHQGSDVYPVVETYDALSNAQGAYTSYEWSGGGYVRTANKIVYRVDGDECGTREECRNQAHAAMQQHRVDRAVKIWENVHGVSWI